MLVQQLINTVTGNKVKVQSTEYQTIYHVCYLCRLKQVNRLSTDISAQQVNSSRTRCLILQMSEINVDYLLEIMLSIM